MATRKSGELQTECQENGITLVEGRKYSREDMEIMLRDFYWKKDHGTEPLPEQFEVMLADKIDEIEKKDEERGTHVARDIWEGKTHVAQLKLNGCRLVMEVGAEGNRFISRNKSVKDFLYSAKTDNLPFHSKLDMGGEEGTVLDGEIVAPYAVIDTSLIGDSKGTITAGALQACAAILNCGSEMAKKAQEKYGPLEYHVFDILKHCGTDVRQLPYAERIELLEKVFADLPQSTRQLIKLVPVVYEDKRKFYEDTVKSGAEGIMLKDLRAPYEGKRCKSILKAKRFDDVDAFVVGFIPGDAESGWADLVGALIFAVVDKSDPFEQKHIIGCMASMPLEYRRSITEQCDPYMVANDEEVVWNGREFVPVTKPAKVRKISYRLKPEMLSKVAVVRGQEFTKNIRLQHCRAADAYQKDGAWHPWREDKRAEDCQMDISSLRKSVLSGEGEHNKR